MATALPVAVDEIAIKVQTQLSSTPYACTHLYNLKGGTANFIYRGTLAKPLEDGSKTVCIKHTEGYVALNPSFKLTTRRSDYEAAILKELESFPSLKERDIQITTPRLLFFDEEAHTQIYTDLPHSIDLKNYVLTHLAHTFTQGQCLKVGHALGSWTKAFHEWANDDTREDLRMKMMGNREMGDLKFRLNYTNLVATCDNFPDILGEAKSVFQEVEKQTKKYLESSEGVLIHGDFWSGNIILPDKLLSDLPEVTLFVIDWELSHLSTLAFDLGQMIAELYELKHFKDIDAGIWLTQGFMSGYGALSDEEAFRTAIHVGAHLVCWGSRVQGWGSIEQVEDVVSAGRDWVIKGFERDRGFFEGGALGCLFKLE